MGWLENPSILKVGAKPTLIALLHVHTTTQLRSTLYSGGRYSLWVVPYPSLFPTATTCDAALQLIFTLLISPGPGFAPPALTSSHNNPTVRPRIDPTQPNERTGLTFLLTPTQGDQRNLATFLVYSPATSTGSYPRPRSAWCRVEHIR